MWLNSASPLSCFPLGKAANKSTGFYICSAVQLWLVFGVS